MKPKKLEARETIYRDRTIAELMTEAHDEVRRGMPDYWPKAFMALARYHGAYVERTEGLRQGELFTPHQLQRKPGER